MFEKNKSDKEQQKTKEKPKKVWGYVNTTCIKCKKASKEKKQIEKTENNTLNVNEICVNCSK